ncbi:hypothetical protein GP486_005045 [Trichoglossum hirsutum]|uniref:CHAT domain-containing protein n=1 Tax=Trichoglossum hirsutum TaxID=265104 RepID=A0A9P8L9T2_9PEZI|nr:hypothetical protein GP486_005045 [Trichoglossum hirsutum]
MDRATADIGLIDTDAVKERLILFRAKGQYSNGHEFFTALPEDIRRMKTVAIEAAQLYLVQGYYIRAARVCADTARPLFGETPQDDDSSKSEEIWDEDSVCLELIRAYTDISHRCKLKAAVSIASRVYDIWLTPRDSQESTVTSSKEGEKLHNIFAQYYTLSGNSFDHGEREITISQSRILIEFYYHKIMVVAGEQGLLDQDMTTASAVKRLAVLQAFTESRERLREARYLLYFRISLLGNDPAVEHVLRGFLYRLRGVGLEIEKALTLVDLAGWQMKSGKADVIALSESNLREATGIFERTGHKFGVFDIEDLRITHSQELSPNELFLKKQELGEKYFSVDCYQNGIRCWAFSVTPVVSMGDCRDGILKSIQRTQEKVDEVGGELLKQLVFVHSVSAAILHAPEYGYALRSLKSYITDSPPEIAPKNYGLIHLCLQQAYASLGDYATSLNYAEKAFTIFCKGTSYIDKSDAAFQLAFAQSLCRDQYSLGSQEELSWLESSITLLVEWIAKDKEQGYNKGEQEKCLYLAGLEDLKAQFHNDVNAASRAEQWFKRAHQPPLGDQDPIMLNSVAEIQVREKIRNGEFDEAIAMAHSAFTACQTNPFTPLIHTAQSANRIATTLHLQVRTRYQHETQRSMQEDTENFKQILSAAKWAYSALELYRSTKGAEVIVACTNYIWSILEDIITFSDQIGEELLRAFIIELEKTEEFCDSVRRGFVFTGNIQSLMGKRQVVSRKEHLQLYLAGAKACLRLKESSSAWVWIQKGKARGLSDAFGFRALIPDYIMDVIKKDKKILDMYERERRSAMAALHASPEGYIGAARKAETDRDEMVKIPILAQVVALREGAFDIGLDASELARSLQASNISKDQVKYIDWFIPEARNGDIVLFVRQLDHTTHVRSLPLTLQTVENWIRKSLYFPEGADPPLSKKTGNRLLAEMDGLVDGLKDLTAPDDLLVLSPTGPLNSIPLHGLKVDGRVLVDRNLIIYSSSVAVFRHCLIRANDRLTKAAEERKTRFLAVYEEPSPTARRESLEISRNVDMLASRLPGKVIKGSSVTKDEFRKQSEEAGWIHYHGHAHYAKDDVLKSSLVLSDGTDISSISDFEELPFGAGRSEMTVSDIFDISMMDNGPHFTIIACESGMQDIAAGDEPLGLIPAFLYAGATSILGCLWPVDSSAGRIFSEKFYRNLKNAVAGPQPGELVAGSIINLAWALREAVREMIEKRNIETRQPYYWAPFVLHGSWFHIY